MSYGIYPISLNCANILPIHKPKRSKTDISSYRPIAITSVIGRLFDHLLAAKIQTHCISNNIFCYRYYPFIFE